MAIHLIVALVTIIAYGVDQFPWTANVETEVLLSKGESIMQAFKHFGII